MKFARLGALGHEVPVVVTEAGALDLRPITVDIDGDFLSADPVGRTSDAIADGRLPRLESGSLRVGAPIARPSAIICIGMNYAAHAAESGSEPPVAPIVFLKTPNTIAGPADDLVLPRGSTRTDWEAELGVVIGRRTAYLDSPDDAGEHIAGYVAANDLSERAFQFDRSGGQWSKGKCAPGFSPIGPYLVTADSIDPTAMRVRSWVNGEPRQDSSTADMIFSVAHILWDLSQHMTLEPGDLILTGTPEGVALSGRYPYLAAADVLETELEGLGRQRQHVVPWRTT